MLYLALVLVVGLALGQDIQEQERQRRCYPGAAMRQDPNNCYNYMWCSEVGWVSAACYQGMFFDERRQGCVRGQCRNKNQHRECHEQGEIKPHSSSCRFWRWCDNGRWINEDCGVGKHWNAMEFHCQDGPCPKDWCVEGNRGSHALRQNPENCYEYQYCSNYRWYTAACGDGQWFFEERQQCVVGRCQSTCRADEEGNMKADPDDCSKFYICNHQLWVERKCGANTVWDESKLTCVFESASDCTKSKCKKEEEGKRKGHHEYCHKLYLCQNGLWEEMECPVPGTHWDDDYDTCVFDFTSTCNKKTTVPTEPPPPTTTRPTTITTPEITTTTTTTEVPTTEEETEATEEETQATEATEEETEATEGETEATEEETEATEEATEATEEETEVTEEATEATEEETEATEAETEVTEEETEATEGETEGTEAPTEVGDTCSVNGKMRADPTNCRKIQQCKDSKWMESGECEEGTVFNSVDLTCEEGSCDATDAPVTEEGGFISDSGEDDGSGVEVTEIVTEQTEEPFVAPSDNAYRMKCTVVGETLPHASDIGKFQICIYGEFEDVECPPGLIFDSDTLECRYAVPNTACRKGSSGRAMEGDCTKFLYCLGGTWSLQDCPAGTQFSPTAGRCVKDFECAKDQSTCSKGAKRSHSSDCSAYEECDDTAMWQKQACPEGQVYDPVHEKCGEGVCSSDPSLKCGMFTDPQAHPWTVSLLFEFDSMIEGRKNENVHECGGTILNEHWILTTRNCFIHIDNRRNLRTKPNPSRWLVKSGTDRYPVSSILIQKLKQGQFGDLALVKVLTAMPLSTYRNPVCLPSENSKAKLGEDVLVTSWELHQQDSTLIPRTHGVTIPETVPMRCSKFYGSLTGEIAPDTDCVGLDKFETSKCSHDTGSPVVADDADDGHFNLYAVISGDQNCGHSRDPSLYQRVQPHLAWIQGIIGK